MSPDEQAAQVAVADLGDRALSALLAAERGSQVFFVPPACLRRVFVKIESQVFVVPSDRLRAQLQRAQDRQPL